MAVVRDVMPAFELFQPASVDEALALVGEHRGAWVLAGGLDSFDWLKDRIKRPAVVVDLSAIAELKRIELTDDGLDIGAMATLTEVVDHPIVRKEYRILADAAEAAASPQIRNQGTIGGNLTQDTRCWSYRSGWECYRAGGNICYADTPVAVNREHAILGADRCVAVNPSDTAPALVALEAKNGHSQWAPQPRRRCRGLLHRPGHRHHAHDRGRAGRSPDDDPGAVRVGGRGVLLRKDSRPQRLGLRARERRVGDRRPERRRSTASGIVVNGVAPTPVRLARVEEAVRGRPRNEETAEMAGQLSVEGARPLHHNGYKVPLMRNLVKRAIRGA